MKSQNQEQDLELKKLRDGIDKIDASIAQLLSSRFELVQEIGKKKSVHHIPVLDPERENNIIASVRSIAKDEDCADFIQKIFEQIFKGSRDKQVENMAEKKNLC